MLDRVSNDEIRTALDELTISLGVKEKINFSDIVAILQREGPEVCIQEIANRFGLPVRINLSYVPKDFVSGNTNRFRSSGLAKTDWTGHGIGGIIAQVSLPPQLPMYGTSGLDGYPIQVRISENCLAYPETFVALMAHELSHVLLASLHHPKKDSELYTDLVPITQGFGDILRMGRKTSQTTTSDQFTTTTTTTTYGYLTDSQFDFAYHHVMEILNQLQSDKDSLLKVVNQLWLNLKKGSQSFETVLDYLNYIDRRLPGRIANDHAQRVVQLHSRDYSQEWKNQVSNILAVMEGAESYARGLDHYTNSSIEHLKKYTRDLVLEAEQLEQVIEGILEDKRMLSRYVGFIYRLRRNLIDRKSEDQNQESKTKRKINLKEHKIKFDKPPVKPRQSKPVTKPPIPIFKRCLNRNTIVIFTIITCGIVGLFFIFGILDDISFNEIKIYTINSRPTQPTLTPKSTKISSSSKNDSNKTCTSPWSIGKADVGKIIEVCGRVTNVGTVPCPSCALGEYSFINLDDSFLIISYDSTFHSDWINYCFKVSDTVEMLGSDPVFVISEAEGYAGSKCTTYQDGTILCLGGDYFKLYFGCR